MTIHLPAWWPAVTTIAGAVSGMLHREIREFRKLMKGAHMPSNPNFLTYVSVGLALMTGIAQEKKILSTPGLSDQEKAQQMAVVAAQQLPKILAAVPSVPQEIVQAAADAQLDEKIIEAVEAGEQLVKDFLPHKAETSTPEGQTAA